MRPTPTTRVTSAGRLHISAEGKVEFRRKDEDAARKAIPAAEEAAKAYINVLEHEGQMGERMAASLRFEQMTRLSSPVSSENSAILVLRVFGNIPRDGSSRKIRQKADGLPYCPLRARVKSLPRARTSGPFPILRLPARLCLGSIEAARGHTSKERRHQMGRANPPA